MNDATMDETTILSMLLKESAVRRELVESEEVFRHTYSLDDRLASFVRQLDPDQLEAQATGLLKKRFSQVRLFLPQTCAALGEQAWPLFETWGEQNWPTGHRRHLNDAFDFFVHCHTTGQPVCLKEGNRLRFDWSRARLRVHWLGPHHSHWFGLQIIWKSGNGYRDRWWVV